MVESCQLRSRHECALTPELRRTAARDGGVLHASTQAEPRSGLGLNELLDLTANVLADSPQDAAGVDKREVTQTPWAILRGLDTNAEPLDDARVDDVLIPRVNVLNEEVHHEVRCVLLNIELLQQETRLSVADVGEIIRRPRNLKSDAGVKVFGPFKVARRDESLDLYCCKIHGSVP